MNTYNVKMNVEVEVQAFSSEDAEDYVHDIFNVDDEIKSVSIINIKEK